MKMQIINSYEAAQHAGTQLAAHVRQVIEKKCLETFYQPIISLKNRAVIGVEALSRITLPEYKHVTPAVLFEQAAAQGLSVELDRLCRDTAIQGFQTTHQNHPQLFLFLNFDTTILDKNVMGSLYLFNIIKKYNIAPQNVVIEICESKVKSLDHLRAFINSYKQYGFLFALDDIGTGHSNLDRILLTKPDVLKVDRCIVQNLDQDFYKQELFSSIVSTARKIGALVLAEGIETANEAMVSCELGAELLQGFYFSRPFPAQQYEGENHHKEITNTLYQSFKKYRVAKISAKACRQDMYEQITAAIAARLEGLIPAEFDEHLQMLAVYPGLEYLYVLSLQGIQVSSSVCDSLMAANPRRRLFNAADKGADQSLKDYFLYMRTGRETYMTEPYISGASGNLCITSSRRFQAVTGEVFILCADFTDTCMT